MTHSPVVAAVCTPEVSTAAACTAAVPCIEEVDITARVNYPIVPLPEGDSYLGFIFARGETPEQVEAALREAHSRLRFQIQPSIELALTK